MRKNIHAEPIDDSNKVKLALYEDYLKNGCPSLCRLEINQFLPAQ
jgi:hypothetical protein